MTVHIFGRGLKRSSPHKIAHRLGASHLGLTGTPKGSADLAPFLAPRKDQGGTETCHAHSLSSSLYAAFAAAGKKLPFDPSPLLIASTTYSDLRAAAFPSGDLPVLQDTGAELQDDANAVKQWGIAPMGAPVEGRYSDVPNDEPGVPFPEPDVSQLQIAGSRLIGGEYSIAVDSAAPETCALALDAGIPVWLGTLVDMAFQRLGPNDIAQPANASDPTAGGHAMYLSAYRTSNGKLEFRVENSWGSGWALAGAVWVSEAWITSCWDLWPCAVAA